MFHESPNNGGGGGGGKGPSGVFDHTVGRSSTCLTRSETEYPVQMWWIVCGYNHIILALWLGAVIITALSWQTGNALAGSLPRCLGQYWGTVPAVWRVALDRVSYALQQG